MYNYKHYCYKGAALLALMSLTAPPVFADDSGIILDTRLRYEHVTQDGLKNANSFNLRVRGGYDYKISDRWRILGEAEGVIQFTDEFNDPVDNRPGYATVADPEVLEINRLQISYTDEHIASTLGRQRIILDNARFVGNVGFRQNEQTYDAFRVGYQHKESFSAEYIYLHEIQRIFGDESLIGNWDSQSHIVRAGGECQFGRVQGYGLLLEFDNALAATGQTWGASWVKGFDTDFGTLKLRAEGAIQSEYKGNGPADPVGYRAASAALTHKTITGSFGVEVLEGSNGKAFITPLATLHKFQGWADVFLATPAVGIRDIQGGVNGNFSNFIDNAKPISWGLFYHDFASDNGRDSLGYEFDAVVKVPISSKIAVETKMAVFNGGSNGPADRTKLWVALSAKF